MGIAIPVEGVGVERLVRALERQGWSRPPRAPPHYRERIVDGTWVWFGKLREGAYVLSSDVLADGEGEEFLRAYREGVRRLEAVGAGLRDELGLPGVVKVDLEWVEG